jgi:hypothetical protein
MATLIDGLVPDGLWALVERCCRPRPALRMVAGTA